MATYNKKQIVENIKSRVFDDSLSDMNMVQTKKLDVTFMTAQVAAGIITTKTMPASIETVTMKRIGQEIISYDEVNKVGHVISGGTRIGVVTILGDAEQQNISMLDSFRQGKNVKNFNHFMKMNVPLIRVNPKESFEIRNNGYVDHMMEKLLIGDSSDINVNGNGQKRGINIIPYHDRLGSKFDAAKYIEAGKYILGYPIITDNISDWNNFISPDALGPNEGFAHSDGAIEVFEIRRSFANTNAADIQISGISADLSTCHQEIERSQNKKGSSIIDTKFEFRQNKYDWFEDAQDLIFSKTGFPKIGTTESANYKKSLEGYISDGNYISAPFVDENANDASTKYTMLNNKLLLLSGSNKNISEIGTRFKSMQNGFILSPKYDKTSKTVFGVDSIAFKGLMRG